MGAVIPTSRPISLVSPTSLTSIKRQHPSTGRDDLRFNPSQEPTAKSASKPRLPARLFGGAFYVNFGVKKDLRPIKTDSHSSPTFRSA